MPPRTGCSTVALGWDCSLACCGLGPSPSVPSTEGGSRVGPYFLYLYSLGAMMASRMESMFNIC